MKRWITTRKELSSYLSLQFDFIEECFTHYDDERKREIIIKKWEILLYFIFSSLTSHFSIVRYCMISQKISKTLSNTLSLIWNSHNIIWGFLVLFLILLSRPFIIYISQNYTMAIQTIQDSKNTKNKIKTHFLELSYFSPSLLSQKRAAVKPATSLKAELLIAQSNNTHIHSFIVRNSKLKECRKYIFSYYKWKNISKFLFSFISFLGTC